MSILNIRNFSALAFGLMMVASSSASISPVFAKHHKAESGSGDSGSVNWVGDLPQALEQARASQKYVLMDVYTDWCGYCKKLDATTYTDPRVTDLLSKSFVCVKVNAEKGSGREITSKYGVHGYPTIIVFSADGTERGRIPGYMGASAFARTIKQYIGAN